MNTNTQLVMISDSDKPQCSELKENLINEGIKVHEINMSEISYDQRERVIKSLLSRTTNGIDDLLYKRIYRKSKKLEDMPLSEVIKLVSDDISCIRTPIIINEFQELVIGKLCTKDIGTYTGRF